MTSSRQPRPIQPVPVVLDTCVLLSRPVSSLLLGLAQAQYVQPYWSHLIKEEWWRHAGRLWGWSTPALEQLWHQWQEEHPQACLGGVQAHMPALKYSDPKDWHVIAAARAAQSQSQHHFQSQAHSQAHSQAFFQPRPLPQTCSPSQPPLPVMTVIVTRNTKDFNRSELRRLGLLRQDPDQFLRQQAAVIPGPVWADLLIQVQQQGIQSMQQAGLMPKTIEVVLRQERLFNFHAWLKNKSPQVLTACADSFKQLTRGDNG